MKSIIVKLSPQDLHLGELPWYATSQGYVRRDFSTNGVRKHELLHRVVVGAASGDIVDHINGDKLDNRRENLRICSHEQNMRNRKMHKNNALGVKGVYKVRDKFRAQIRHKGVKEHLGNFVSLEAAKTAYDIAAIRLHQEFSRLN